MRSKWKQENFSQAEGKSEALKAVEVSLTGNSGSESSENQIKN